MRRRTSRSLDLIDGYVTVPFHESGELSVDYAVAEAAATGEEHADHQRRRKCRRASGIVEAMRTELAELCPTRRRRSSTCRSSTGARRSRPRSQSALAADPNIKWVLPIYDSMSIPAIAGIRGAGKARAVKVASYNGTPDVMKLIENGDIMAADMGENIELARYANMDQALPDPH